MFKNKSFIVKMVDDRKIDPAPQAAPNTNSPETIVIEVVMYSTAIVTSGFIGYRLVKTACDVVVIAAHGKFITK